jgi:hypothetical protein
MIQGKSVIKHFTAVIHECSQKARVFVSSKPFQPSVMFVGEARANPSKVSFSCFTLGKALALPTNIRLT